jgi:hypothetical protein
VRYQARENGKDGRRLPTEHGRKQPVCFQAANARSGR